MAKTMLGFKDLFLVGFFLSIGLSGPLTLEAFLIGAAVTPFVFIKPAVFFGLLTGFKLRAPKRVVGVVEPDELQRIRAHRCGYRSLQRLDRWPLVDCPRDRAFPVLCRLCGTQCRGSQDLRSTPNGVEAAGETGASRRRPAARYRRCKDRHHWHGPHRRRNVRPNARTARGGRCGHRPRCSEGCNASSRWAATCC